MRSHFPVAVHLLFRRQGQVLLLRRFNTGWQDGHYSVPAGHVDAGETVTQAAMREAHEEIGVQIDRSDLAVVHVMNRKSEDERIDFFLAVHRWKGEIANCEPDKCDDVRWFAEDALPANLIPYVGRALDRVRESTIYSEFGWQAET